MSEFRTDSQISSDQRLMRNEPIDAVITWVDGNDPVHRQKRLGYASPEDCGNESIAGEIRYTSIGEINYCVASILRFAPWIRNIYIVTDRQDPHLEDFVERHFPGRGKDLHIIDHTEVFRGMEELLPTFNSLSIESVLWRIPGLSERFVYFNDDTMLSAPVRPEDFFDGDRLVCPASHMGLALVKLLRELKHIIIGPGIFGFKDALANSADIINSQLKSGDRRLKHILLCGHTPHVQFRDILEEFFTEHPDLLRRNAGHRFRDPSQFNPQELCYLLAEKQGRVSLRPLKGNTLYLKPKNRKNYIDGKIRSFDKAPQARFCCLNSLANASTEDIAKITAWLERRIGLTAAGPEAG